MSPPPEISVVIAVYGDLEKWIPLATKAIRSARQAGAVQVVLGADETLAKARNRGAEEATGDYLVFLDADDELSPGYIEAMGAAAASQARLRSDHPSFLYQPATLGVVNGKEDPAPWMIPQKPLEEGNFMVIGTMLKKSLFMEVGGFHEWDAYEDWELFIRCWKAGAGFIQVPDAVYRVHVNPKGRNSLPHREASRLAATIRRKHFD